MSVVRLVPFTRKDWERDPEAFHRFLNEGKILIMTEYEGNDCDKRVAMCQERASRMVKRLCAKHYAKGMGGSDVDSYFAYQAMVNPEAFVNAFDGTKKPFYRFVAINVGIMAASGIFGPGRQKKLARALAEEIDTMEEDSIYKRINQGYNSAK